MAVPPTSPGARTTAPELALDPPAPVEQRETHCSWVLLAGDRAYKIKKPVVLPFLDYGTAERRHAMCRAEVALNRRLAPGVYLGVRSLVPAPDGRFRLGGEDDAAAVDSDVIRKRRAGLRPTERAPARLYRADVSVDTYRELGRRAAAARGGVIVDATFRRRADRAAFTACLPAARPVLVVECQAPRAVLESRVRARAADPVTASDAGIDVVRRQLEQLDPFDDVLAEDHLRVRSDRAPTLILDEIADALDRRLLAFVPAVRARSRARCRGARGA